ncbi:MAG: aminotransferase class V-fold PLP-dependent enzyme [Chloroflexota bacterium]|nr:aminotransferase class V-fold PLP-dependent enzyme [Chloroflexota bacterium]
MTFLNHGSFGACPETVLATQAEWRDRMEREPVLFLGRELEGLLEAARAQVGAFIGADPDDLAFVPNATAGVNTVLRSLNFAPGDELLTTDHEYNATLNAIGEVARGGEARVVIAAIPFPLRDASEAVDAIIAAVTPRTRLALVSHVTSPTGLVLPVADIVRELAARGVDTIVDAAHAPGMVPVDVTALGAAYWTGTAHKWICAPKGSAVLHVRRDRQPGIRPLAISHGANDPRSDRSRFRLEFDWTGTLDPTPWLTVPAAIDVMRGLLPGGWPAVMATNRALALAGRDLLCGRLSIEAPAPDEMIGSLAAVLLPMERDDVAAAELQRALFDEDRIEVPVYGWPVPAARPPGDGPRGVTVRISAQLYNRLEDVERLATALQLRLARGQAAAP